MPSPPCIPHSTQINHCKHCMTEEERLNYFASRSVNAHRYKDKQRGFYNANTHITREWIKNEIEYQKWKCFWCPNKINLEPEKHNPKQPTVDRLYNDTSHSKSNCVIACYDCNSGDGLKKVFMNKAVELGIDIEDMMTLFKNWIKHLVQA